MGNRLIKESICTSETIEELSWMEEVFFYRLLVSCDDYGIMDARPKILKARLFPLRDIDLGTIETVLRRLTENGLIRRYTVEGKPYLQVITWNDHQRIRDSKHKYPTPDEADAETEQEAEDCGNSPQLAATCRESPQNAARARAESESESNPNPNPNPTRGRARERPTADMDAFDTFWTAYPNKKAKQDAIKAWNKLMPDAELVTAIMAGLSRQKLSDDWQRDGGRYVPHPATWLNGRRWEDEVTPAASRQQAARQTPAQQYTQRDYSTPRESVEDVMRRLNGGVMPGA